MMLFAMDNIDICPPCDAGWIPEDNQISRSNKSNSSNVNNRSDIIDNESTPHWTTIWKERLSKASSMMSFLCVIDCTLLPLLSFLLPLLNVAASSLSAIRSDHDDQHYDHHHHSHNDSHDHFHSSHHHEHDHHHEHHLHDHDETDWLHELGHKMAINFVLPIGIMAGLSNYATHRDNYLLLLSIFGLCCVYLANGEEDGFPHNQLPHEFVHQVHCGTYLHRVVNLTGCFCMLTSNYLAKQKSISDAAQSLKESGGNGTKRSWFQHVHTPNCFHNLFLKSKLKST